ncbi:protocadherin-8-like [Monodelphis domestica]|uniref:protocadherin-8-like n=1 Tax=Monodelphis domestica TaxID=13616 RepID=UPI0024E21EA7|nr:protocadherin-8-like [Monodelphis domestica]
MSQKKLSFPTVPLCSSRLSSLWLVWMLVAGFRTETVNYHIYEEEIPGTVIGVLSAHTRADSPGMVPRNFRLMKQFNTSLIRLSEDDGQLTVGENGIDREQLCQQSQQCTLTFDVVSFSQLIHVEVEVRDINDHSPRFPRSQIPVEVSESAAVGTRIPLEVAVDEDVGSNALQSLRLVEPHSFFRVELQTRADGAKYADLLLLQELDRESQANYSLELVAQDGGDPPRSATAVLSVRVLDANDHSPVFPLGSFIEVEVSEDSPEGSLLLDIDATDPDEGPSGDVVFFFGGRTPPEAQLPFHLDPRSGHLTLTRPLDYEQKETYELDVMAQDQGPGSRVSTCKVIVHILDVNDNAPVITIIPLVMAVNTASDYSSSFAAPVSASWEEPGGPQSGVALSLIPEGAAQESLVALVSTLDRDSDSNGQVHCALYGHEHFRLQPAYAGSYLVLTTTPLDRERIPEYNLTLVAQDLGSPPLSTMRPYTVRVADENDNAPLFARPVYEVSVLENNFPGAYLTTVVARDPDLGRNGKVTYRLLETKEGQDRDLVSAYVSVDSDSGVLRARRRFDREALAELEVALEARDGGSPSQWGQTVVRLVVEDQNDHAPEVIFPLLSNGSALVPLPRGVPPGFLVTRVQARDEDEGPNAELTYSLTHSDGDPGALALHPHTGELSLRRQLSPWPIDPLTLVVTVQDNGRPSLSCTTTLMLVPAPASPPGGNMVLVPPPPLPPPSREEQAGLQKGRLQRATGRRPDLSTIFIGVLAGGCGLLLVAIVTVASSYQGRGLIGRKVFFKCSKRSGLASTESWTSGSQRSSRGSDSKDSESLAESYPLSVTDEVEEEEEVETVSSSNSRNSGVSLSPSPGERSETSKGSVSAPFHSTSPWKEDKSAASLGTQSSPDECSVKDSGKGDSEYNDSDSDIGGERMKKISLQMAEKQAGVPVSMERRTFKDPKRSSLIQEYPKSKNLSSHCDNVYKIAFSSSSIHQHHSQLRNINFHTQDSELKEYYYQVSAPQSERLLSVYERAPNSGTIMPLSTLLRQNNGLNRPTENTLPLHTSEISTSF